MSILKLWLVALGLCSEVHLSCTTTASDQANKTSEEQSIQQVPKEQVEMNHEANKSRVYTIGGLDYWTGLLDWTTGLPFHLAHAKL